MVAQRSSKPQRVVSKTTGVGSNPTTPAKLVYNIDAVWLPVLRCRWDKLNSVENPQVYHLFNQANDSWMRDHAIK